MNIVESWFINPVDVITQDNYDEQNDFILLNNATLEILRRLYADHSFGSAKGKNFSFTLEKRRRKGFLVCPSATIISSQHSGKSQDVRVVCIREVFWDNTFY